MTGQDKATGQDFFFSCQLYFFTHSLSSSYLLPLFHCLISILLFFFASVSCMSFPFSIAIMNGTYSLRSKVYISTGIPTRVVGTCLCAGNLGSAGNLSICLNFKVFLFVMTCNNKKYGTVFGCHITFCAITQYL